MEFADADGFSVAFDDARLLLDEIVCWHDEDDLLSVPVELELRSVHLLLLQLVRGQLYEGLVLLAEEALDEHEGDVRLARACLNEDD